MRDIAITLIVLISLPYTLKRPYIGILMWIWMSVMNPHRLSWGFAYDFPFAAIIACATLFGLLVTKDNRKLPFTPIVVTLMVFTGWMVITTVFSLWPDESTVMMIRVLKIMLMTFVTLMVIDDQRKIYLTIWTLVISLGYYGIKGGIFTVLSGGSSIVWGPDGSFIEGNNELALALITIIPMFYCLFLHTERKWERRGIALSMVLCGMSALGSYSRGALLGMLAMVLFLWLKSPKKALMGTLLVLLVPLAILFMPDKWSQRMDTINTYQADASAMGRINAWHMAFNLASHRPLVGGGFEIYNRDSFAMYAPDPDDVHAAHSIYFQVLGEHGFVGLFLYLLLAFLTWIKGRWIIRHATDRPDLRWAANVATMIQVSMIGFAVGGAFLSLLYYDVPYYLMALMVSTGIIVERELKKDPQRTKPPDAQLAQRQPVRDHRIQLD